MVLAFNKLHISGPNLRHLFEVSLISLEIYQRYTKISIISVAMNLSRSNIITLKEAITTIPLDSHRYLANLPLDHCYLKSKHSTLHRKSSITNSAAHGGLLVSVIISAVQQHFSSTLQRHNQPHTFDIETIFLRPATAGRAVVEVKETKLGANMSTIHFVLLQNNDEKVVGYASYVSDHPHERTLVDG